MGAIVFVVLWQRAGSRPVPVEEVLERFHPVPGEEPDGTLLRPRQGVYRYRGSGTERISTPPRSQSQGPEIPATVEHRDDGCWTFRIDYSSNHWQTWDYCPRDGGWSSSGARRSSGGTSWSRPTTSGPPPPATPRPWPSGRR
ncbi:MAG: hypothetical protein M5U14_07110 [Acidimicrobiia bacterium]|nr:hypothetical protein [Acidimicrobiia bacterium]